MNIILLIVCIVLSLLFAFLLRFLLAYRQELKNIDSEIYSFWVSLFPPGLHYMKFILPIMIAGISMIILYLILQIILVVMQMWLYGMR